jgi:ASC-1-like (ASCH) protein
MEQTVHKLKLNPVSFEQIKEGSKKIEVRLYDEKRRKIKLGDSIEFSKEPDMTDKIRTEVVGLLRYRTFSDLVKDYPSSWFGSEDEKCLLEKIYSFYTHKSEDQFGVIGIRVRII